MGNVFSKMYLVPEDSMKKFREEIRIDSVLDSEMLKILKLKKIADTKKWYLYRQLLMKHANTGRARKYTSSMANKMGDSNTILIPRHEHDEHSTISNDEQPPISNDERIDEFTDSAREQIENLSMLRTPEVFRRRSQSQFEGRPSINLTFSNNSAEKSPNDFRKRVNTESYKKPKLSDTNILTDDENDLWEDVTQGRESDFHEKSESKNTTPKSSKKKTSPKSSKKVPPKSSKKVPPKSSKKKKRKSIGFESKTSSTPVVTDFFKKVKKVELAVIPPFKEKQQQGQGRFKWTSLR